MFTFRACSAFRHNRSISTVSAKLFRPRRAFLYMQGHDERKIGKAGLLDVDVICLDMEDGVAHSKKQQARLGILKSLGEISGGQLEIGRSELNVRINAFDSGLEEDDVQYLMKASLAPDSISLPKVESPLHVHWLEEKLSQNPIFRDTRIFVMIESPLGLINMRDILKASEKIDAVIFGADDYAAAVGATRSNSNHEVNFARNWIVNHASAFGAQAIDLVNIDLDWNQGALDRLCAESIEGFQLGFSGKQVIHPKQIQTVQTCFTPSDDAIRNAHDLIEAHNQHQESGKGAFVFNGKMIDMVIFFLHLQ